MDYLQPERAINAPVITSKTFQEPVDHNIVILGDSHNRGLSNNMKNNLDDKYSVY